MKKLMVILLSVFLVFSIVACAQQDSTQTVMKAREGKMPSTKDEFNNEVKAIIQDYKTNYDNITSNGGKITKVTFETDFDIEKCSVSRVSSVDDNNIDVELNGYLDLAVETTINGNKATIETAFWYGGGWVQEYPIWSYLVQLVDTDGNVHYYYFRVDYSSTNK